MVVFCLNNLKHSPGFLCLGAVLCCVAPCPHFRPSQSKGLPFCHTPHFITSLSVSTNTPCMFPHRARWRRVSPPECNLAVPLSLVSSVTLCSHSIRVPRLRGAADKILIILAHRIKGTRTEGAHACIYKRTASFSRMKISHQEVQ